MRSFGLHVDIWEEEEADALPLMRAFLTTRRGPVESRGVDVVL